MFIMSITSIVVPYYGNVFITHHGIHRYPFLIVSEDFYKNIGPYEELF